MRSRILSLIGLAVKAGRAISGEFASEKAIKSGNAFLVILAADASDNTIKHFSDMCNYRDIPYRIISTKEELGRCTGKISRAVVTLADKGFADSLMSAIEEENV